MIVVYGTSNNPAISWLRIESDDFILGTSAERTSKTIFMPRARYPVMGSSFFFLIKKRNRTTKKILIGAFLFLKHA